MKYVCCVGAGYIDMKLKIMDGQPIQRMSKCIIIFGHRIRSFLSSAMYKVVSTKIITMSGSVF